ncbi:hypothetical protein BHE74_00011249 [Ensete ventricosum]|nr:hypothetical protein GW17_00018153 [Ensete ventricosum]RWW80406.1 hypothetical protein BHE74_00011249 [Ensete ventricosum]
MSCENEATPRGEKRRCLVPQGTRHRLTSFVPRGVASRGETSNLTTGWSVYRDPVGPVCTAHTGRYSLKFQTLVSGIERLLLLINLFSSCFSDAHTAGLIKYRDPYPFGVDPRWRGSRSELPFLNSIKMKMSILLGVSQMNLGIILSYFDAKFHGSFLDIRYILLLLMAIIAVPWMLFPKPFILRKLHTERFQGRTYGILGTSEMDLDQDPDSARRQHHEDFNFSEVFVHQMIHSIEFVLGAVSNTASYLRLWALRYVTLALASFFFMVNTGIHWIFWFLLLLSLAHSELSTVFYEKLLLLAWG